MSLFDMYMVQVVNTIRSLISISIMRMSSRIVENFVLGCTSKASNTFFALYNG
ncbi:unnamed protein product, partial [Nesidiocoris tenuis]